MQWRSELPVLSSKGIPGSYIAKGLDTISIQTHGLSDTSENVYAGVICLHVDCSSGDVRTSLVISKVKVCFLSELAELKPNGSCLLSLHFFLDTEGVLHA